MQSGLQRIAVLTGRAKTTIHASDSQEQTGNGAVGPGLLGVVTTDKAATAGLPKLALIAHYPEAFLQGFLGIDPLCKEFIFIAHVKARHKHNETR